MESDGELYKNLVTLLKFFKGRPYYLAKYLVDNSALSDSFIEILLKSDKLKEIEESLRMGGNLPVIQFNNISDMQLYYKSLQLSSNRENMDEVCNELNEKLDNLIKEEKFEEAAGLRDYMKYNKIRRK